MNADKVNAWASGLRGTLLTPDSPGYREARQVWNASIDRCPALIARCAGAADVIHAVRFARENNLSVAVRGGGHNIAGNAVCEGGLVIDLSGLRTVRIDPERRRASVDPGATLADFDHEAQAFGLAAPVGINSTTGIAGLTLGGGFGWLSRKFGLTIDNLLAADIVTADARLVQANAERNADLFWGIRGGGGNFGIVTRFEFALHPVGPQVVAGLVVYPYEQVRTVLERYRQFADRMPDDMNAWVVLRKAPPLPFLPPEVHGKNAVVLAIMHMGEPATAMTDIAPLRSLAKAYGEHLGPMPFVAWQQAFDPLLVPGARNYWKSHNFLNLSDGLIDALIEYAGSLPSDQCEVFLGMLGGKVSSFASDATAYTGRDAKFVANVHGRWDDPAQDAQCIAWARRFFAATSAYASTGAYVNFMTEEEADRIPAAYGANYPRLAMLKKKYDPSNFFRFNQNIRPAH